MTDKRMTADAVAARIQDGMTIGVGGWGSRRKPMALIRAILRTTVKDLTLVAYGGPEVGLLCRAGKVRRLIYGFVSLDSIPLDPNFRLARQAGSVEVAEYDEGMCLAGLTAAAHRLPFMPIRAGLSSDVMMMNPGLRTVASPYDPHDVVVAVPPFNLDVALVHLNAADRLGNAQYLGPDPYFDDLFCMAAKESYVSCERILDTAELTRQAGIQSMLISRMYVTGVVETPNGAHFTSCDPDYARDEAFQRHYVASAADPEDWARFADRFLGGNEEEYQAAVRTFHAQPADAQVPARTQPAGAVAAR
jgi:glutaconate CoA-transferase subunit A